MNASGTLSRHVARWLCAHARAALPPALRQWGLAMERELDVIGSDTAALRWAVGCTAAAWKQSLESVAELLRKPSAALPVGMSLTALAIVLSSVVVYGVQRDQDEGAAAHLWQLLMGGQAPLLAWFALKWLPRAPRAALCVVAMQACAALAALAPVYLLGL